MNGDGQVALRSQGQLPLKRLNLGREIFGFNPAIEANFAHGGVRVGIEHLFQVAAPMGRTSRHKPWMEPEGGCDPGMTGGKRGHAFPIAFLCAIDDRPAARLDDVGQARILEMIMRVKKAHKEFAANWRIVIWSCCMPLRRVGVSSALSWRRSRMSE